MSLSTTELAALVAELQPLCGAIIQRVDLVADLELVLELRRPGRSVLLLLSGRPGAGRLHLVPRRPPREREGGELQSLLRRRLSGPLCALEVQGQELRLKTPSVTLHLRTTGGRGALRVEAGGAPLPPSEPPPAPLPEGFPLAEAVAARYQTQLSGLVEGALRARLLAGLRARRKKQLRLQKKLRADLDRMQRMAVGVAAGELLKASLHQVKRGQAEVELMDWAQGATVRLALDPRLSPQANLQRLFDRAKKGKRGIPLVQARLQVVEAALEALQVEQQQLQAAQGEALQRWAAEGEANGAGRAGPGSGRGAGPGSGRGAGPGSGRRPDPIAGVARRFWAEDGSEIWVGKSAKDNDQLSFHLARSFDLWLHARGRTGSHVILRLQRGRAPGPEALLDAAHLAVHYSSAAKEAKAEVTYAEVKRLRKVKGAAPGQVSVAKSKTLLLSVEPARLRRLLDP